MTITITIKDSVEEHLAYRDIIDLLKNRVEDRMLSEYGISTDNTDPIGVLWM